MTVLALRLLLSLLLLATSACGFRLAGSRPLPAALMLVRIDMVAPYRVSEPPVEEALRTRLVQRGATTTEKNGADVTVIRLTDLTESRQVLSTGSDGKAQEFQLILRVTYDVRTADLAWSAPEQIEVRRDYSFNEQQVLAKEQEADRLREFMQGEMAELLLLRIEAAANLPASVVAPPAIPPDAAPVRVVPPLDPAAPG